jgi:hypothetical protein
MVDPLALIGQAIGPFALPCHSDSEYDGKKSDLTTISQCAGAAIYRSNLGIAWKFPAAFHILKEDKVHVFASAAELLAKFREITVEEAEALLKKTTPDMLLAQEFSKSEVRLVGMGPKPAGT